MQVRAYSEQNVNEESQSKGVKHTYKASNYAFQRAMEYSDVSAEMVRSKVVEIEVAVTQRYTRKSYVIATLSIPLRDAVRKLVKTKIALTARESRGLPENMKVYNARDILSGNKVTRSHPPSRYPSNSSLAVPYDEFRAQSDPDLNQVRVDSAKRRPSSVVINLPQGDQGASALQGVQVLDDVRSVSSQSSVDLGVSLPNTPGDFEDASAVDFAEVKVSVPKLSKSTSIEINTSLPSNPDSHLHESSKGKKIAKKDNRPAKSSSRAKETKAAKPESGNQGSSASRPETPAWDNYSEPLSFDMVPIDFEHDHGYLPRDAVLPMATKLQETEDVPKKNNSRDYSKRDYTVKV